MPDVMGDDALYSTEPVGSPLWWYEALSGKMARRRASLSERDDYYEGKHPLTFATTKFAEAFGDQFSAFADNWCQVVVDSSAERLTVDGFRFGDEERSDQEVWDLWQRNGLDAESGLGMTEAIKMGEAYALVEPTTDGPKVTIEHPLQTIVVTDPADRRNRLAALKKWRDPLDGTIYATVYLSGKAYRFQSKSPVAHVDHHVELVGRVDGPREVDYSRMFGDAVPAVPLLNNPSLLRGGRSDLEVVIPLQRAINKLGADLMVASEFTAFRQRVLTGVEIPRYPEGHPKAGEPMSEAFISAVSRLWVVESQEGHDAKAQEFSATDLENYVKVIEMYVGHISAQTRIPPHYLIGQVVNVSGDALKAAETGLVSKVRGKALHFGQAWEEVTRLMLKATGDPQDRAKAEADVVETVWTNPETRSEAEAADAAVKLKDVGVPRKSLWRRVGFSEAEIRRMETEYQAEQAEMIALGLAGTRPGDQGVPDEPPGAQAVSAPNGGTPGGESDAG